MQPREDVRLRDRPMRPLACGACGARVEVRKSTWDQTSIQWHAEAQSTCLERRAADPVSGSTVFPGCGALRESIREAAVRGELSLLDAGSGTPGTDG